MLTVIYELSALFSQNFGVEVLLKKCSEIIIKGDMGFEENREDFNSYTYCTMSLFMYCPITFNPRAYSEICIKSDIL